MIALLYHLIQTNKMTCVQGKYSNSVLYCNIRLLVKVTSSNLESSVADDTKMAWLQDLGMARTLP